MVGWLVVAVSNHLWVRVQAISQSGRPQFAHVSLAAIAKPSPVRVVLHCVVLVLLAHLLVATVRGVALGTPLARADG